MTNVESPSLAENLLRFSTSEAAYKLIPTKEGVPTRGSWRSVGANSAPSQVSLARVALPSATTYLNVPAQGTVARMRLPLPVPLAPHSVSEISRPKPVALTSIARVSISPLAPMAKKVTLPGGEDSISRWPSASLHYVLPQARRSEMLLRFDSRDLPLVAAATAHRTPDPTSAGLLQRQPNATVGTSPQISVPEWSAHLPDLSRQVSPEPTAASRPESTAAASPPTTQGADASGVNLDDLVDRVSRRLLRQLAIERERRGLTQWK